MLVHRLRKNRRHFGKWARRAGIEAFRIYDADVPAYAAAIDVYGEFVHVQEYEAPAHVDPAVVDRRSVELLRAVEEALEVPRERIAFKVRRRQKGAAQYEKTGRDGLPLEIREGPCVFLVDLDKYLDTGLFLDHRPTREWIGAHAAGRSFLNLFCYTATATVHAALGGATRSTSVDLSRTYLDWAAANFARNGIDAARHRLVQRDCLAWLDEDPGETFDLIFVDPPTFSNSKRMAASFDVQRDHVWLLERAAARLAPGGEIVFSNNHRRFKLEQEALPGLEIRDVTRSTIPKDFERNARIHGCWRLRRREAPRASPSKDRPDRGPAGGPLR